MNLPDRKMRAKESQRPCRSRAYRWNEDGWRASATVISSRVFRLRCGRSRSDFEGTAFGLTGNEGNHGEDVKEYYFYLDSTPTHSYMKYLYKYPQAAFPYDELVAENRRRGRTQP